MLQKQQADFSAELTQGSENTRWRCSRGLDMNRQILWVGCSILNTTQKSDLLFKDCFRDKTTYCLCILYTCTLLFPFCRIMYYIRYITLKNPERGFFPRKKALNYLYLKCKTEKLEKKKKTLLAMITAMFHWNYSNRLIKPENLIVSFLGKQILLLGVST